MLIYTMVHECPRCGYCSRNKSDLRNHYRRKSPCVIKLSNITIDKCKMMLENKKLKKIKLVPIVIDEEKQELVKTITMLKEQVQLLMKNHNGNNHHNNNTNSNNITNVINIHSYKNTDYKIVEKAMNRCINNNGGIDVGKLIEEIHFNEKFPQNKNIYIANSKTKRIMKYDGEKFVEDGRGEKGLEAVFNEKLSDIDGHEELNDNIKLASEETWMKFNDKTTVEKAEILEQIYKPLYNKRELVKNLIET
jgi:hypothetical protein